MRTALLSLLALLLLPTSVVAEDVSFTWSALGPRADITEVESMSMNFSIDMLVEGQSMGTMTAMTKEDHTLRVVTGPWTSRKKQATLTYGNSGSVESQTTPDGATTASEETTVVSGKSYSVISKKGNAPVVTQLAGDAVSESEHALVIEEWEKLVVTEPGDFEKALVGKTLTVGQELDSSNEAVRAMLSLSDDELSVTDASITLTEVREDAGETCAVFSLAITLVGEEGPLTMTMKVKGQAIVEVDGLRPHSVTLAGPLTMAAVVEQQGMEMHMAGGGEVNLSLGYTYGD